MRLPTFRGRLLVAALGALVCANALAAQPAASGPWAKVPAFPTACYQGDSINPDPFFAKVEAAKAAIRADIDKQDAVNSQIQEAYQNIDPMEMASRMQQWMMSNPQEAMAYMQAAQAAPAQGQETLQADVQGRKAQEAEWAAVKKRYQDALRQAYAPSKARWKSVLTRLNMPYTETNAIAPNVGWDPGDGPPDWAVAEAIAIKREMDQAYTTTCAQFWSATGQMHTYLKNYKTWLVQKRIPYLEQSDGPKLQTYAIMNTPAATYRSTATLQAVEEYLGMAWSVFQERDTTPKCYHAFDC